MNSADSHQQYIQDVVSSIGENIRELRQRKNFADPEELDYIDAKLQAYSEVMDILKGTAADYKLPVSRLGL